MIVQFNKKIEDLEIEFEEGMMANFVSRTQPDEDGVIKVVFDTSDFDDHNNALMKAKYFDRNGDFLTAREAGWWPESGIHTVFFMADDWDSYFEIKSRTFFGAPIREETTKEKYPNKINCADFIELMDRNLIPFKGNMDNLDMGEKYVEEWAETLLAWMEIENE